MNGDVEPTRWERAVLHVDMECFFVAVEVLDNPSLAGKPVVVGGSGRRGVVAAASYEARSYGVRSAMPMATALRRCPDAVVIDGRHGRYREVSARIMDVFGRLTPLVEPLSLDEAFLDVTGAQRGAGTPRRVARRLRAQVADELGLSCSVGVAANKSVAKLASEAAKPRPARHGPIAGRGVVVVTPGRESAFLNPLPVGALFGVGPKLSSRLAARGVHTVADLVAVPRDRLTREFGTAGGRHLYELARGIDDRPVVADQAVKSVSHEVTFPTDLVGEGEIARPLVELAEAVGWRLRRHGLRGRTVVLKVRYGDFTTLTRSHTLGSPTADGERILAVARRLCQTVDLERGVRLLGVGVSGFDRTHAEQLSLDDQDAVDREGLLRTVDEVRERFGQAALTPARLAGGRRGVGERPWGPTGAPSPGRPSSGGGAG